MDTEAEMDCQDLKVNLVSQVHEDRGGYLDQRGPLVDMELLVQWVHLVDKESWVPKGPLVCGVLQDCMAFQGVRGSWETLAMG